MQTIGERFYRKLRIDWDIERWLRTGETFMKNVLFLGSSVGWSQSGTGAAPQALARTEDEETEGTASQTQGQKQRHAGTDSHPENASGRRDHWPAPRNAGSFEAGGRKP